MDPAIAGEGKERFGGSTRVATRRRASGAAR